MIHPLIDYRIKGMLWYQGEANAGGGLVGALEYTDLLTRMIKGWREDWRGGDLPFYFVQLPNWDNKDDSTRASWAYFREGQARVLAVPKTGMAVTIDIGEHDNIHPANKQAVGSRLAAIALADTYGIAIPAQGPVPSQFEFAGGKVRIRFKHSEGGLSFTGKELNGFMLAGSDQKWHTAIAVLTGDQVILRAAEVSDPVAARYAWSNDPQAKLYNGAGLPAPPFRTDDWR
jgi:sialate O-acetylesterase